VGFHLFDLLGIVLLLGLWLLPASLMLRDSGRRPPAGRALGRRCAIFGLPGALVYFGLLRVHQRLQEGKQERMLR
jgi:hypothetical protein